MTLINWQSKPQYIRDHLDEIENGFKRIHIQYKEKQLEDNNRKLTELITEYKSIRDDIHNVAQLTILSLNSQRELQMAKQTPKQPENVERFSEVLRVDGQPAVKFDDVTNNLQLLSQDYDITIDDSTGEVWLVSNHDKTSGMIQGCIRGFIAHDTKQKHPTPSSAFDYVIDGKVSKQTDAGLRAAKFTGSIFFEDLPVDVFSSGQQKIKMDEKEEIKPEPNKEVKTDEKSDKREEAHSNVDTSKFVYPSEEELKKIPKGGLKPQSGLSRNQRKAWNNALREKYPNCFDAGGNWIGFADTANSSHGDTSVNPDANKKVKETKSANALGLMGETGAGNAITKMTDDKIRNGFMLARHFEGKGYAIVSTPAKEGKFEKSAFIICNKERTAKFMLAGLQRNKSFNEQVDGCNIFRVTELKQKYFENDQLYAYWVTNAVTALSALGTQERDIIDIKERVNS